MSQIVIMIVALLSENDPVAEASLMAIALIVAAGLAVACVQAAVRKMRPRPTQAPWDSGQHGARLVPLAIVRQKTPED